jgi:hypothetical protein
MERKKVHEFVDRSFGFPVRLRDATLVKVRGVWTLEINHAKLAKWVALSLSHLARRLKGNEIRFLRLYFEMTLDKFARRFDVSHPAVLKWEAKGDNPTEMAWSTEKDIRLFVQKELFPDKLSELYDALTTPAVKTKSRSFDLKPVAVNRIDQEIAKVS